MQPALSPSHNPSPVRGRGVMREDAKGGADMLCPAGSGAVAGMDRARRQGKKIGRRTVMDRRGFKRQAFCPCFCPPFSWGIRASQRPPVSSGSHEGPSVAIHEPIVSSFSWSAS